MSLHISYDDFQKMVDKECLKRTGHPLSEYPTIWCEDFWTWDLEEQISVHDAKIAMEACIESAIATLPG